MKTDEDDPIEQTIALFGEFMGKVAMSTLAEWMNDTQLTMAQCRVLIALAQERVSTVGKLAERLKVGEPTASHLVDRMVHGGLAERTEDPQDRRRVLVSLSPEGRKLAEQRLQSKKERLRELLRGVSEEDLAALRQGLLAVMGSISEKDYTKVEERHARVN